jgi:hypothetical protein
VALTHGMWTQVPDWDAPTQLVRSRVAGEFTFQNVAIPAFYFMLMGRNYEYARFGDIWAGILVKRICDHLGYAVYSGDPAVAHQRASNVWANLRKEAAGLEINETFWQAVDQVRLPRTSFGECYKELADRMQLSGEYWTRLRRAMQVWAELFE